VTLLTHWEGEPVAVLTELWDVPLLEVHDRLGSTNDRVRVLSESGCLPFAVVLAEEQTAGRGRSGSVWHDTPGHSLLLSILLPRSGPVPLHLPLLVGLAGARAAERATTGLRVRVQWPNDLMLDGRKVGGVLCEGTRGGVVAGVGINVRQGSDDFPEGIRDRALSLEAAGGEKASRARLAGALVGELRRLFGRPSTSSLPGEALAELQARDALLDRTVETAQEGRGTARGIARDGALVLERTDGSRVRVVAGRVRAV